jgi:hypothetical protein
MFVPAAAAASRRAFLIYLRMRWTEQNRNFMFGAWRLSTSSASSPSTFANACRRNQNS